MGATAEALDKAARRWPDLREYLPGGSDLPDVRTLEQFIAQLELAETAARNGYSKLIAMADAGLDKQSDYFIYAQLQNAIYKAQISGLQLVAALVRSVGGSPAEALFWEAVPLPAIMPPLVWGERHASQLRGLGLAPAIAVAGAVAAVLAALGLMYLYAEEITNIVDDLTDVYIARARAAQQTELLDARRVAFEGCMARGGSAPEDCRAEVLALVPTPAEAGTDIPPRSDRPAGWTWGQIGLAVAGGVVVISLLGGLFVVARARLGGGGFGGYHGHTVSRVAALPARAPDLHGKSSYNLEVR